VRRFDLRSLRFGGAGEVWRRLPVEVAPFVYGGLDYEVPEDTVDLLLTAARVGDNLTLSAEFETLVNGPCQRCLGDAALDVQGRGVEYVRHGDSEGDGEEEEEGYITSSIVDVERWVRDLIAEELPPKLLCREDCLGICAVCGADLNADPTHRHDEA
jgi:uncharacterized protein